MDFFLANKKEEEKTLEKRDESKKREDEGQKRKRSVVVPLSLKYIAKQERLLFGWWRDVNVKMCVKLSFGSSLQDILDCHHNMFFPFEEIISLFAAKNFAAVFSLERNTVFVSLFSQITTDQMLFAFFFGRFLALKVSESGIRLRPGLLRKVKAESEKLFPEFHSLLTDVGFDMSENGVKLRDYQFRAEINKIQKKSV